ncbi:MAG: hypothetical protein HY319_11385 [Armatimonadetes bacterium]|nr:hypothetical protein [Armatimonadota bacterium]
MGDRIEPLEDLLDDIRGEGRLESSGHFTVESRVALEKMARLQLHSPYEYVLKLIQAAVAARAGEIRIDTDRRGVSLLFDRAVWNLEHLRDLSDLVLEPQATGPQRHRTHLAIGLNAARALEPREIEVVSWNGTHGAHLVRRGTSETVERLVSGPATERTRIQVRDRRAIPLRPSGPAWAGWSDHLATRSLGDYGAEMRSLWDSEYSQIWRRALFAPIPVVLDGRAVNRPFLGAPKTLTSLDRRQQVMNITHPTVGYRIRQCRFLLGGQDRLPGPATMGILGITALWQRPRRFPAALKKWSSGALHSQKLPRLRLWGEPVLSCHAILGQLPRGYFSTSIGWIAFVKDGVVMRKLMPRRESMTNWCIVVSANDLESDLSEFGVVENEAYEKVLDCLEQACS